MNSTIKIGMVDDHVLLRRALASVINGFDNCRVTLEADDGIDLMNLLKGNTAAPDIVLLDLSMPRMDGYETAAWLNEHYPDTRILMLTMYDSELTLIRLLQAGAKGFLKKDIDPVELKFAINTVMQTGYYYSTNTAGRLANIFRNHSRDHHRLQNSVLELQEIEFLKLACTDLTYKEIAQKMRLSPRTVDALRDQLFLKLDVKSRVGLVMVAMKNGVVNFY